MEEGGRAEAAVLRKVNEGQLFAFAGIWDG